MSAAAVIAALALPEETRVDRRVPKKLLAEQGAHRNGPQAHSGRHRRARVGCGPQAHEYRCTRIPRRLARVPGNRRACCRHVPSRQAGAAHRADPPRIPHPLMLVSSQGESHHVSLAHKRLSQNERGATVLDSGVVAAPALRTGPTAFSEEIAARFLESLPLSLQPRVHLCCFLSVVDRPASGVPGGADHGALSWIAPSADAAAERQAALAEYDRIEREITSLKSQAEQETQINRRAELNLEIRRFRNELCK